MQKLRPGQSEANDDPSPSGSITLDPASVSMPMVAAEKHPASASAPLDYVKLARTKGTRLIKSVETHKRTYLAVLCGDAGERIELFTVSA